MTHPQHGTATQTGTPARSATALPATTLPYLDSPTGVVVASEPALEALVKTRPWALGFAVLLFIYATVGGAVGAGWLAVLVIRLVAGPPPRPPFINPFSINLLFAPIALVGGWLAVGYFRAAGRAYGRRDPDDLERASFALKRLWLWAGVSVIVVIAFAAAVVFLAMFVMHEWPG
jgi:hypothetical protein